MIIEKLKLRNYRQYRDTEIDFADVDGSRRFTIIQGSMGSGKTNILNSISWCLYGKERRISRKYRGLPIVNTLTLQKMGKGQTGEVEVKIFMKDEEDNKAIFSRHFKFKKTSDNDFETIIESDTDPKSDSVFQFFKQVNGDMEPAEDPAEAAKMIFPEDIQECFFFDGERLDDYFKTVSYEKVKDEVFKISQLDILENVISHLEKMSRGYAFEARGINPVADKLKEDLVRLQGELLELDKKIADANKDREAAGEIVDELVEKLKNYPSSEEVRELQARRDRLDADYIRIEKNKKDVQLEYLDYLVETAPILFISKASRKTYKLIEEKIKSGEIPPKIKKEFLEKLLELEKCICGTELKKKTGAKKRLESLLKECKNMDEISLELSDEKTRLRTIFDKIDNFDKDLKKYNKEISEYVKQLEQIEKDLKGIHLRLKSYDIETIRQIEGDYDTAKRLRDDKNIEYGTYVGEKEKKHKDVMRIEKEYQFQCKQDEKKSKIKAAIVFCDDALEETKKIKDEIMDELRAEIEAKTEKQFFELIWKKYNFKSVKIDENWRFSVLDSLNRETIGSFSAGERQCLALSFLAALNIVSGFNFPIVMDTPLARISKIPRLNIASKLPTYLKDKQVILLLTDEEYTTEVRSAIKKSVGREYKIHFIETKDGCESKVEKYEK
jgi:DNA sulfur modification protein DndD